VLQRLHLFPVDLECPKDHSDRLVLPHRCHPGDQRRLLARADRSLRLALEDHSLLADPAVHSHLVYPLTRCHQQLLIPQLSPLVLIAPGDHLPQFPQVARYLQLVRLVQVLH